MVRAWVGLVPAWQVAACDGSRHGGRAVAVDPEVEEGQFADAVFHL